MNTRRKSRLFVAIVAMLPLLFVVPPAIGQQQGAVRQPYIIFIGTVDALNAVTLHSLTASNDTSVVVVEKIFNKPDAVALAPRDKITVLNEASSKPLQKGVRALFVTTGWIYGESLAVRVLNWEPASTAAASDEAKAKTKMQQLADQDLRASMSDVDLVVTGRVKRIQGPSAAELMPEKRKISEHEPEWQEAIITVQETLKGPARMREVVVRFPRSMDVAWADYPRFTVGQEGTFLLRQDRISGVPNATLDSKSVTAYIAVSRRDVLNKSDAKMIKRLLSSQP
jgi:hypothetical protein